jgi:hypothetical protein
MFKGQGRKDTLPQIWGTEENHWNIPGVLNTRLVLLTVARNRPTMLPADRGRRIDRSRHVTAYSGNREIATRFFILGIRFKTSVTEKILVRPHHRTFICVTAMNSWLFSSKVKATGDFTLPARVTGQHNTQAFGWNKSAARMHHRPKVERRN